MDRKTLIAAKIRSAREELGLSQEELGKLYGSSGAAISQIERNIRNVGFTSLERLASILGKPLGWFLSDEVESAPRPPEAALSELEVSIKSFIPVYAEVSAGGGIEPIDYVASTRAKPAPDSYRAYRVKGLCLEPDIHEGDTLIVDTDLCPRNNDLVVCIIDGQASVLKYRERLPDRVGETGQSEKWLENNNGTYQPEDVYIHGIVVEFNRRRR